MTGYQLCDGHYETAVNDLSREYYRVPVQPLDAILKTEELAQGTAMTMVLGPADLRFRRVGVEPVGEIACDLYVGSFAKSTAVRVWLNPVTGWPVRITHEDIDGAGKSTTRMEIVEIAINEENPDSQFLFTPPEGYVDRMAELIKSLPAPLAQPGNSTENNKLPALTIQATGSAGGGDQSLEKWHGFLLSSTSALFVWKRSVPTKKESETLDWLQNIEMDYRNGNGVSRPLRHAWVQPPQPSQWLWSIVKTVDGKPLGRGIIHLQLRADRAELSCGFAALQLTNEMLDELIIEAATSAGVPASAEPITLQFLRAKAAELE